MKHTLFLTLALTTGLAMQPVLAGNAARQSIIDALGAKAGTALSAPRGKALFLSTSTTGKPETPSCSTCHTPDPTAEGRTRVGKPIAPMAVSRTPDRFTDPEKVDKWFRRNCNSVLGRDCTATEQGDILTWLSSL